MPNPKPSNRVLMVVIGCVLPAWASAQEGSKDLHRAIGLFDEGRYLAAQELLLNIDREDLSDDEQALRDDYVDRATVAINMQDKADQDFEAAEAALAANDFHRAEALFQSVVRNPYAPGSVRQAAEQGLRDAAARRSRPTEEQIEVIEVDDAAPQAPPPAPSTAPAPPPSDDPTGQARVLTQRGYAALDSGHLEEALGLFHRALVVVPGYPEAVTGVERVRAHMRVESGSLSLIDQIEQRNRIRWQRVVATCRDAQAEARQHVIDEQFDLAKQAVLRARQIVEAGRQFADPLSEYENLRAEVDLLEKFVADEERRVDGERVQQTRQEITEKNAERIREQRRLKERRVEVLMEQVAQHRKDQDFEAAIDLLGQVLVIDPTNDQARWMLDTLEDTWVYRRQRVIFETKQKQGQSLLTDVEESTIPWHENLTYPKNWLEIINRPGRRPAGAEYVSPEDQAIKDKLGMKIPVAFDGTRFAEVIDTFKDAQNVNLSVVWSDLQRHGISEDDPVTLNLPEPITLKKALDETLAQLGGGGVELGYVVDEGLIKIASRNLLNRETFVEVYDINDLLMRVPDFVETPAISLEQGGAGGGPRVASARQHPFQAATGGGDDDPDRRSRTERARDIVELIRDTVAPESWREGGGTDASIRALEANLVVTQTASAHEQISDLLSQLRQERAIQIAVEARFLTVTANYLEELGIDLDIILNQGNAGFDRVNRLGEGPALLLPRSFSRLGFGPSTPGVGTALDPGVVSLTDTTISQPYGNPGLVPGRGSQFASSSRTTPIPILSDVLQLTQTQASSVPGSLGGSEFSALTIFGSFLDNIQVDFLLRATQADRRGNTMSAPRLVLFNGQRAWVGVLREQAYVSDVQPVVDESAVAQQPQTNQILTGAVLDVQATVSADKRYVTMTLRPGVAVLDGIQLFPYSGGAAVGAAQGGFIQLPTRSLQIIRTTVSVPDGGTLLIGGMKVSEEVEIEAGVPVLSKIPVLKRLYSNRSLVKDEAVLLILVKPTIIISREAEEEAFPTFGTRG